MKYKVFFYEAFEEEQREIKRNLDGDFSAGFTSKTIQAAGHGEPPADIISVRTQSIIPEHFAGRIKGILTRSTGYDHIKRFRQTCPNHVPAGYLPLYCNRAVAEQAMLLWTALLRKFPRQISQFEKFNRDGITGLECKGRNIAIFGVGNIGYQIVRIARGLEMNPLAVDPVQKHDDVQYTTEADALERADIIVCAMNLTEDNRGYFNTERFMSAGRNFYFVNIARGELCDNQSLVELLESQKIIAAGLDVYPDEQQLGDALRAGNKKDYSPATKLTMKLARHPNVICTPHNAFNTQEAVQLKASQSVQSIIEFIRSGKFPHPV